jgi:excisionase family DNA binding protein
MLTLGDLMTRLNCGRQKATRLITSGKIAASKVEGQYRIEPDAVQAYLLRCSVAAVPSVPAVVASAFDADRQFSDVENPFQ